MFADAVVNPDAMVIKLIDTPVTFFAMFACLLTVTITILTVVMVDNNLIYLLLLVLAPFVSVNYSIGRVRTGNQNCEKDHQKC